MSKVRDGKETFITHRFLVWGNKGRYVNCRSPYPPCLERMDYDPVSHGDSTAEHGVENLHDVFYRGAFQENAQLEV